MTREHDDSRPFVHPDFPDGTLIDADGIITLPNGVDLGPVRVCRGCGGIKDQYLIHEHPSGGWFHTDFCMPPPDWQGEPSL